MTLNCVIIHLLMGQTRPLFHLFFVFKQQYNCLRQINLINDPSSIRRLDSNSRPLDRVSSTMTTRAPVRYASTSKE